MIHEHCGRRIDSHPPESCPDPGAHHSYWNPLLDSKPGPSHVMVSSQPAPRPADPVARELADGIRRIEYNYQREGSGPGSRFEGRLLEDVQAEWVMRELLTRDHDRGVPRFLLPAGMTVKGNELHCKDHGKVWWWHEQTSLRTLSFEARRHWSGHHG